MPNIQPYGEDSYQPMIGLVYIFNLIVGTGALAMPKAVMSCGWLISSIVIIILCLMSYVTTTFVIETMSLANAVNKYTNNKKNGLPEKDDKDLDDEELLDPNSSCNSVERNPLLINDDNVEDETLNSYFEINQRLELGEMSKMFFSHIGVKLFYICIIIYLFGDLSIYAAAIAKSFRDVTCNYQHQLCNQTINLNDQCWTATENINRSVAYRIYLVLTLVCVSPFAFFNVQKTKYLQMLTTILRWIAFVSMIGIASVVLISGNGKGKPKASNINGIPNLFGVCVYSFMCHHSLPALITPIRNKSKLFTLIFIDYCFILVFYCLLSFTGIFAFDKLQDIYTLNFQVEKCTVSNEDHISQVPILDYFLPLFPVFTLSTNFPIISITLQNNLKTLFMTSESNNDSSFLKRRLFYPFIAVLPPFGVAFATEDLEILVGIVGSYAGACIQYIIPAMLIYYSRQFIKTYPSLVSNNKKYCSPFSQNIWILIVIIWSVICIIFVTLNHIIQFNS